MNHKLFKRRFYTNKLVANIENKSKRANRYTSGKFPKTQSYYLSLRKQKTRNIIPDSTMCYCIHS